MRKVMAFVLALIFSVNIICMQAYAAEAAQNDNENPIVISFDSVPTVATSGDVCKENILSLKVLMALIPENVLKAFNAEGDNCVVLTTQTYKTSSGQTVNAFYNYVNKSITITVGNEITIRHEFGHYIDAWYHYHSSGDISKTKEWAEALEHEKELLSQYDIQTYANTYTDAECFAEAVRIYWFDKEAAKKRFPEIMRIVERAIEGVFPVRRNLAFPVWEKGLVLWYCLVE